MGTSRLFEDFSQRKAPEKQKSASTSMIEDLEDQKLKSFEEGYGAGWDDAIKAQHDSGKLLVDTVQQSLIEARLVREDALQAFISATRPLLDGLVRKVLPALAEQTLPHHVAGLLSRAIEEAADLPLEIRVAEDQHAAVARLLEDRMPETARLVADPDLAAGQACCALGQSEKQIDLPGLLAEITDAVEAFYNSIQEEV
jgi:flagellar biosynthesis/type III secretory pathway protein FliH